MPMTTRSDYHEPARNQCRSRQPDHSESFDTKAVSIFAGGSVELMGPASGNTTRLAEIFRYALAASERDQARLADELEFLRSYLEIERTRFGSRLRLEEAIEPGLDAVPVPSLLLQPLVENAVRYAVAPRPEGGTVRMLASMGPS